MFSQSYIVYLSNKAAVEAVINAGGQGELIEPYEITSPLEVNAWESTRRFPFKNLGAIRPAGWKLIDDWLVDATGFGAEYEPALTIRQLAARIREAANQKLRRAYAIIEVGQFQVVLGVFEPDPDAKLTLAGEITESDWEDMASEMGFESSAELKSYAGL